VFLRRSPEPIARIYHSQQVVLSLHFFTLPPGEGSPLVPSAVNSLDGR
jgi:hypothetical protein